MANPSENPAPREEEPEPAPGSTFVFSYDPNDFPPPPPPRAEASGTESDPAPPPSGDTSAPRSAPAAQAPAGPPWTSRDRVGVIAALVVIGGVLLTLGGLLYAVRPVPPDPVALPAPKTPVVGELFTLKEVKSGWRARTAGDLVSEMPVVLPSPGMREPVLLPEVRFSLAPSKGGTGFLRFIFMTPQDRIAGDVRIVKVVNGVVGSPSATSDGDAVYASVGFTDTTDYLHYAADTESARWYVEVSESTDENASEPGWRKLQVFEIGNERLD